MTEDQQSYAEHTPQTIGWCEKGTHPYPSLFKGREHRKLSTNQPTQKPVRSQNTQYAQYISQYTGYSTLTEPHRCVSSSTRNPSKSVRRTVSLSVCYVCYPVVSKSRFCSVRQIKLSKCVRKPIQYVNEYRVNS